jgi:hypothetical protein
LDALSWVHDLPLLLLLLLMVIWQRGRCTAWAHAIFGAAIMLMAMPLDTGAAHPTLRAVIPDFGRHPFALAEAIPKAIEAHEVFWCVASQSTTKELKFKSLSIILGLFPLAVTCLFPFIFPLSECVGIFADLRP